MDDEGALEALLERARGAGLATHAMSEVAGGAAALAGSVGGAAAGSGGSPAPKSRVILAIGPAPSDAVNAVVGALKLL